ncbi:MAG: hypothetical protein QNI97_10715 [Desulfobacterales bacterium]|nr:hypothetical protein [Desulfobacterales bacterium]
MDTFYESIRKRTKRKHPRPALPCASPNRSLKRRFMPPCGVAQLARVLTIWRLLRASLHRGALPDSMMLASSIGYHVRRLSELASLKQADKLFPISSPMLGAGQREKFETPSD